MDLGFVYRDTVISKLLFNIQTEKEATYQHKKNELKKKLLRPHTDKNDRLNRSVLAPTSYSITIGIKYIEKVKNWS